MDKNIIPQITDPLGKHWRQPSPKDILIDDTHAMMDSRIFESLSEYSTTLPTGVYSGKMWKTKWKDKWFLQWYADGTFADSCSVNFREILF